MPQLEVLRRLPASALTRSVDDYMAAVKARGLSPRTTRHYEAILRGIFLPFLAESGIEDPKAITQKVLDRFNGGHASYVRARPARRRYDA